MADYSITLENGESFTGEGETTSSEASETQGIDWLSSCRSGACSL